ncbi:hypothetical protein PTH_2305 [Pelotomaculum thermopropionicum SI]|uniref:Uncharacterized protein n=1 Tax=Pelotomaculum thermopropionicum (strain DSM 13744 / JCM 10971 / SI) TaxID=370438 RepID=A5CZU8_PELTS|nr:hypothetical protein PTH_2305 [Pelotomaculum thermopropionicum SI]
MTVIQIPFKTCLLLIQSAFQPPDGFQVQAGYLRNDVFRQTLFQGRPGSFQLAFLYAFLYTLRTAFFMPAGGNLHDGLGLLPVNFTQFQAEFFLFFPVQLKISLEETAQKLRPRRIQFHPGQHAHEFQPDFYSFFRFEAHFTQQRRRHRIIAGRIIPPLKFSQLQFVKPKPQHFQKRKFNVKTVLLITRLIVAEYGHRQDPAPVFFIQPAEISEHPFVKISLRIGLCFHMHQNHAGLLFEPGFHQDIHQVFFSGGDVGEHLLLQKPEVTKIYGLAGGGEEQIHEFGEKGLQQFLEQPVVVCPVINHFFAPFISSI